MSTIAEYSAGLEVPFAEIARSLTAQLDAALPDATGQVWHGHPVWMRGKEPIAGFKAYPRWVTFMIWGEVDDPSGTLEQGPRMATVKLTAADQLDDISRWVA